VAAARMEARFEVMSDEQGHYSFALKGKDGATLLLGMKSNDRVAMGIDVVHVRRAVRNSRHFVPHQASDGAFVVLKDTTGEVLAKSPRVPPATLKALVATIQEMAPIANIHEPSSESAPGAYH
jgi:uncharacterized protein YegP (UPF0339 family)